ncbi:hypothetical protein NL676_027742 [Syzygium grande]|nr:hypothetical protein NL676_027742 [Syzygium grande]
MLQAGLRRAAATTSWVAATSSSGDERRAVATTSSCEQTEKGQKKVFSCLETRPMFARLGCNVKARKPSHKASVGIEACQFHALLGAGIGSRRLVQATNQGLFPAYHIYGRS